MAPDVPGAPEKGEFQTTGRVCWSIPFLLCQVLSLAASVSAQGLTTVQWICTLLSLSAARRQGLQKPCLPPADGRVTCAKWALRKNLTAQLSSLKLQNSPPTAPPAIP